MEESFYKILFDHANAFLAGIGAIVLIGGIIVGVLMKVFGFKFRRFSEQDFNDDESEGPVHNYPKRRKQDRFWEQFLKLEIEEGVFHRELTKLFDKISGNQDQMLELTKRVVSLIELWDKRHDQTSGQIKKILNKVTSGTDD